MRITVETFRPFRPCAEGVAAFQETYPDGIEWTRDAQLAALLTDCRRWLGWAWRVGAVPLWSMCRANLTNTIGAPTNERT